ncbi:MAG: serine/threonine protein kinase [Planctomycetes bacterium]|nr:serine/threonine protein kinase [Planctomycetota bacterium]
MDDAALARVLLERGVPPDRLEVLRQEGTLRPWALRSGHLTPEEVARLAPAELTPGGGVRRGSLETRDSGIVVIPRDRTRTVTSDGGRAPDAPPTPEGEGYPELPAETVVRTRSGLELVVERELGRGGMGIVYLVRDPRLKRLAALKLVREGGGPQRVDRFRREAMVTAHIAHPGVPPVYETGVTDDGRDYLLLRYVAGRALSELLARVDRGRARHRWLGRRGPWAPPRELLQALVKVGEALAYAHSRGIVHRDLKPDNVMVGAFGEVLLMDWGLARDAREEQDLGRPGSPAARSERLVGTVAYMAPEQAREEDVDPRADVFALGAILLELLTGHPPFAGEDFLEALARARRGAVPRARALVPEVAPELDAIAARATAPIAADRYGSAAEMADDLRAYIEGRPVSVHRYGAREWVLRQARAHPTLLVALALLIGGVAAVAQVERRIVREQVSAARLEAQSRWTDLERRPRSDFEKRLGQAWAALQAADRWHALAPEQPEAALARLRAAFALGEIALGGGQWSLAQQAFQQALALGIDDARARQALDRVAQARTAHDEQRRAELRRILDRIEASPEPLSQDDLLDAAFEVVRRGDRATGELAARLDAITEELARVQREALAGAWSGAPPDPQALQAVLDAVAVAADDARATPELRTQLAAAQGRLAAAAGRHPGADAPAWLMVVTDLQTSAVPVGRRQLALVLCEAQGRLGDPAAVPALIRYVLAQADPAGAAAGGRALVRLGQEGPALAATQGRFGAGSVYADELRRLLSARDRS